MCTVQQSITIVEDHDLRNKDTCVKDNLLLKFHCTAWDIAVTLMECGEVAKVRSSARFAYGERGKAGIPSNATITYELELLEVLEPIKFGSLTEEELIKLV